MDGRRMLIPEYPLILLPSLAVAIGLNEAIVLQQICYWLSTSRHEHEGRIWIYNSYDEWQTQLPFLSRSTIQRTMAKLVESGLILTGKFSKSAFDHRLWYTIDFEKFDALDIKPQRNVEQVNGI